MIGFLSLIGDLHCLTNKQLFCCFYCNLQLYPFGSSQNDAVLPEGDDVISQTITLSENFIFYSETVSTTSVC